MERETKPNLCWPSWRRRKAARGPAHQVPRSSSPQRPAGSGALPSPCSRPQWCQRTIPSPSPRSTPTTSSELGSQAPWAVEEMNGPIIQLVNQSILQVQAQHQHHPLQGPYPGLPRLTPRSPPSTTKGPLLVPLISGLGLTVPQYRSYQKAGSLTPSCHPCPVSQKPVCGLALCAVAIYQVHLPCAAPRTSQLFPY